MKDTGSLCTCRLSRCCGEEKCTFQTFGHCCRIIEGYEVPCAKMRPGRSRSEPRHRQSRLRGHETRPFRVGDQAKGVARSVSPHQGSDVRVLQRQLSAMQRKLEDQQLLLQVKVKYIRISGIVYNENTGCKTWSMDTMVCTTVEVCREYPSNPPPPTTMYSVAHPLAWILNSAESGTG